ncbi:hypothetical protein TNCV_1031081, partial [Trichonephila clavipes]
TPNCQPPGLYLPWWLSRPMEAWDCSFTRSTGILRCIGRLSCEHFSGAFGGCTPLCYM